MYILVLTGTTIMPYLSEKSYTKPAAKNQVNCL